MIVEMESPAASSTARRKSMPADRGSPRADRTAGSPPLATARITLRINSHPMIGDDRREEMRFGVEQEQHALRERSRYPPPWQYGRTSRRSEPATRLRHAPGDQQTADHVRRDALARGQEGRADAKQHDRDPGDARAARGCVLTILDRPGSPSAPSLRCRH